MALSMRYVTGLIFSYFPRKIRDIAYYRFLWSFHFPEIVHIENTNACNAKCIMCPREKMNRKVGVMDFALFKKIIDECALHNIVNEVHLHGYGECLIENDFYQKILYAREKGIPSVYIVTNGSLLSEAIATQLILSGLDRIKISFYGATEETYEKIHVNLKFKEVEENVIRLFELRKRLGRQNPAIILQFLPQQENMHEREIFGKKWQSYIQSRYNDAIVEYSLHNYASGRQYNNVMEAESIKRRSCILPSTTMQILWSGEVVPCCFDFNGSFVLGDVKKQTLQEIWNSQVFSYFRKAHSTRNPKLIPICKDCDQIMVKN